MSEQLQRQLVLHLLAAHPLPWTIESDWTVEVVDANGKNVVKLQRLDPAEELIAMANAISAELASAGVDP